MRDRVASILRAVFLIAFLIGTPSLCRLACAAPLESKKEHSCCDDTENSAQPMSDECCQSHSSLNAQRSVLEVTPLLISNIDAALFQQSLHTQPHILSTIPVDAYQDQGGPPLLVRYKTPPRVNSPPSLTHC